VSDAAAPHDAFNAADFEALARDLLEPGAYGYFAGGAGDERTLRDNIDAYARRRLRPRVLVDVSGASASTTVLGTEVSMPLLVAPVAFQRVAHPDGEAATARAAADAGTVMCLSTLATSSAQEVADAAPGGAKWFQLYCFSDRGVTEALVDQAVEGGYKAIVLTVDAPLLGRRERDLRTGFAIPADLEVPSFARAIGGRREATLQEMFALLDQSLTWRDVEMLAELSDLPVVVKGLITPEDARLAVDHGAGAIVVSNHGGRQLDGAPATLDALPDVVEAVDGRVEVYVDGGVRRGTDVAMALALGARAVLIGRPVVWALAAGGQDGVRKLLGLMRDEIELALALLGCPTPEGLGPAHVTAPVRSR
jgi:isopentenyl diphosphate isomerase/L-lactate dehydrogenase-like FMN-dependent dehydrogenase